MVCAVAGTASYQRLSPVSQRGPPACPPEPPLPASPFPRSTHAQSDFETQARGLTLPAAGRCRMFIFFF